MAQLALPLQTPPALGREDFIVAPGNREAVTFLDSWPGWPAPAGALFGPPGCGKSHLVAIWAGRAGARVIDALALDAPFLREDGAVAVENVDAGALDEGAEHALFALMERGAPLLLTGREPPSAWRAGLPDLTSRWHAVLAYGLWEPDDALIEALARKLFDDRQLSVPDAVVAHMLHALERSPSAIRDFVARADERALAEKKPISVSLVRSLLSESA
jgi:chromosomal replication initiation ATPase DnaA